MCIRDRDVGYNMTQLVTDSLFGGSFVKYGVPTLVELDIMNAYQVVEMGKPIRAVFTPVLIKYIGGGWMERLLIIMGNGAGDASPLPSITVETLAKLLAGADSRPTTYTRVARRKLEK